MQAIGGWFTVLFKKSATVDTNNAVLFRQHMPNIYFVVTLTPILTSSIENDEIHQLINP